MLNIDTKQINKGIITINGNLIKTGMTIHELASDLQKDLKVDSENVGYVYGNMIEDDKPMSIMVWFKDNALRKLNICIGGFSSDEHANEYSKEWLERRGITEWVGDRYYKTTFGSISPSITHLVREQGYELCFSLEEKEIPTRKYPVFKDNKKNSVRFTVDATEYKVQRITESQADTLPIANWLGNGPQSLSEYSDEWTKYDRKEVIYYSLSQIENGVETIVGVAEFTYLAILDVYNNDELFYILDSLTAEWGIIGQAVEKSSCGFTEEKQFSPYLLVFEMIHDEIPYNKELKLFKDDVNKMKLLFESVASLTSKYVEISEEELTLINVSKEIKSNLFSNHKAVEDVYVNFQRLEFTKNK